MACNTDDEDDSYSATDDDDNDDGFVSEVQYGVPQGNGLIMFHILDCSKVTTFIEMNSLPLS